MTKTKTKLQLLKKKITNLKIQMILLFLLEKITLLLKLIMKELIIIKEKRKDLNLLPRGICRLKFKIAKRLKSKMKTKIQAAKEMKTVNRIIL